MSNRNSSLSRPNIRRPSQALSPVADYQASPRTVLYCFAPSDHHSEEEEYYGSSSPVLPARTQFETDMMITIMPDSNSQTDDDSKPAPRQVPSSLLLPSF